MKKIKKTLGAVLTEYNSEFYIMKDNRVFRVNEAAARIFELCNNTDHKSISKKISVFYKKNDEIQVENDVIEYIFTLEEMGLVVIK